MKNRSGFTLVELTGMVAIIAIVALAIIKNTRAQEIGTVVSKGGLFTKDKITVLSFDDPDIKGVTCYTTRYKRSMSFTDSTNSSLSCRQTGRIEGTLSNRENVFSQQKAFFGGKKTLVTRMIDRARKVIVYLSYTKGYGGKKNASHSISVVPIMEWK